MDCGEVVAAPRPQIGWFELSERADGMPSGPWFHWHYEQLSVLPSSVWLWIAAAIVGGLLVSQLLTLFTTPVIYLWFDRIALRLSGRSANSGHTEAGELAP